MKSLFKFLAGCCLFSLIFATSISSPSPKHLILAAITTDVNDHAYAECWELDASFQTYPTVGESVILGDTSNLTYVALPPRSKEGIHRPPSPMYFILLTGQAHVTFPYNDQEVWIEQGVNDILIANDIKGIGHFTAYPGNEETRALQVPFKGGVVPLHKVVENRACNLTKNLGRSALGVNGDVSLEL
jgi:hypothetical protein